jgi:hypothetical protein
MDPPTPESSGSTTRTEAPPDTADWASVSCVVSLPWAFCTLNSDAGNPALVRASVM